MDSPVIIRYMAPADLPAALDIYNELILNTTNVYSEEPHTLVMRTAWFNERMNANFPVIIAEQNGVVVGFGAYGQFRIWRCYRFTVENSVYVHKDHRGKGYSKLLLSYLINHAKQAGMHAMIAGIDGHNTASINLHSSFGFVQVAHFKEVGFKFGRWLDVLFLQLLLS